MFKLPKLRVSSEATLKGVAALGVGAAVWLFMTPGVVPIALMDNHVSNTGTGLGASPFGVGTVDASIDSHAIAPPAAVIALVKQGRSVSGCATATLSIDGAPPRQFVVGDVLARGVRLTRILPDSVELQHGNVVESLPMSSNQYASSSRQDQPSNAANDAAFPSDVSRPIESTPITPHLDQPPPSSNAVQRAIGRASQTTTAKGI